MFRYRAWHILSECEKFVGFWPYQDKRKNFPLRIFNALMMFSFGFGLRKEIFEKINVHFETIVDDAEVQILRDYSEKGLFFTVTSLCSIVAPVGVYLAMPLMRMFYLYFYGDGTSEKILPIYVDYLVDEQEHFFHIVAYIFFTLMIATISEFTFDLMFFLTVRHICALFEIVKIRLNTASEILMRRDKNNKLSDEHEAKAYELISSAVQLHNEVSELTETLDDAYKVTWFFILLLNAIALAPTPLMPMLYKHDSFELFRRSMALIVIPVHFYVIFTQGQINIDRSESVFDSCYDFCWYDAPKRFQLAISIVMTRSLKPSRLTGVLFDLSMETYSVALRLIEKWNDNLHIAIENVFELESILILLIKMISICTLDERRKQMFERIVTHFETIDDKDEIQILRDHSEKGLRFTVLCILLMGTSIGIYLAMPVIRMLSLYFLGNGMLEKKLPVFVDFLIDEQEYFFYIVSYMFFVLMVGAIVNFAFDLAFFLTVRHICALFDIVKLRLERASDIFKQSDEDKKLSDEDESKAYDIITSAVDVHNDALKLTQSLDEAYKVSWFFILLSNAIALAPIPVMVMLYKNDTYELCRRCMSLIVYPLHFYIIFLQGQMSINYSESVFDSCYDICWYNAPKRCRLAIYIMMIRSSRASRLTGVLFDLSMQTYSVMLKTVLSYVSVFQALDL